MGSFSKTIGLNGYPNRKFDLFFHSIMNKIVLALFLFVIVLSVQSGSSSPVPMLPGAHSIEKRSPRRYYGGRNRYSSGSRVNQGLKNHGRQKFATGAGLWALGAITGNQGWQNTGAGLAKLGLLSKVGAHVLG